MALGRWGESRVARVYEAAGYEVLDRNWRVRGGELDLVLGRGDEIVFCEVKARRSAAFGGAVAAVTPAKQAQVRRLAESWLRTRGGPAAEVRFDVVAIDGVELTHYEAAF